MGRLTTNQSSLLRTARPVYVQPYDRKEKHMPGMNFCGPGTNVTRRMRNGVQPMDKLDALCRKHDIDVEPRGPYLSKGNPRLLRASDRRLLRGARRLLKAGYKPAWKAAATIAAMEGLLLTGARGRS